MREEILEPVNTEENWELRIQPNVYGADEGGKNKMVGGEKQEADQRRRKLQGGRV